MAPAQAFENPFLSVNGHVSLSPGALPFGVKALFVTPRYTRAHKRQVNIIQTLITDTTQVTGNIMIIIVI